MTALLGPLGLQLRVVCGLFLRKLRFRRCKLVEDPLALVLVDGVTQLRALS